MKILGLILSFFVVFSSVGVRAQSQCVSLFQTHDGATVLSTVFGRILNAPKNSTVKIFTKNLNFDGISSLLLLVSVYEARKERGLKFEFYLEDSTASKIHDLFAESSKHKIKFRSEPGDKFNDNTLVVVESKGETSTYRFEGQLNAASLKDASLKRPILVRFGRDTSLRASPFKKVTGVDSMVFKATERNYDPIAEQIVISSYSAVAKPYTETHKSQLDKITAQDIDLITDKAYDLALQLHLHNKGTVPPEKVNDRDINIVEILQESLKN